MRRAAGVAVITHFALPVITTKRYDVHGFEMKMRYLAFTAGFSLLVGLNVTPIPAATEAQRIERWKCSRIFGANSTFSIRGL